jgi:predicted permease
VLSEFWSDLRYRLRALLRRAELERDLDDELRFHIDREAEKHLDRGAARDEALRRARSSFGGLDQAKEGARDARGTRIVDNILQDSRYAWRGLRARPAFAVVVVATLALGIGVNAAMFGVLDRLLLRPPAFLTDPSSVHRVYLESTSNGRLIRERKLEYTTYADLVRWSTVFSASAGFAYRDEAVGSDADVEELVVAAVTGSFFDFFSTRPVIGRFFSPREDVAPLGSPVVVLSHSYWQSRYGGSADVLDVMLRIGAGSYRVIGVAPAHFEGVNDMRAPVAFVPVTAYAATRDPTFATKYTWSWLEMLVRRKPGVTLEAATVDLTNAYRQSWLQLEAGSSENPSFEAAQARATPHPIQLARGPQAGPDSRVLKWVSAMALIVLLIACANVANLLLVRAVRRRNELVLRSILGGSRARITQQLLTEILLLALLGGVFGLAAAQWAGGALRRLFLDANGAAGVFGDARTLVVAAVLTLATAAIAGLAPALQGARAGLPQSLRAGARSVVHGSSRTRSALVITQVALSVVLLVGAGLFVNSLAQLRSVRLGYDVDPIVYVRARLRDAPLDAQQRAQLVDQLEEAARSIPGVTNATPTLSVPFRGGESQRLYVPGIDSVNHLGRFALQAGSADYFATMGTHIVRGRGIEAADRANTPRVAVVSEAMAGALWPGRNALGQCFRIRDQTAPCTTVVGVAEDVRMLSLTGPPDFIYYLPKAQYPGGDPWQYPEFFVRVSGRSADAIESIRRRLQSLMPGSSYIIATPLQLFAEPTTRPWRIGAALFVAFGALALVLAAIGLYAVIAFGVAQRTRELGVRTALGASNGDVLRLVVGGGMRVTAAGAVAGTVIALISSQWLTPLLFNVSPRTPAVYVAATLMLLSVGVLATALPAIRATRIDPNRALRAE